VTVAETLARNAAWLVGRQTGEKPVKDNVIAVGLLTQDDLERLGATFTRHFPIVDDDMFADLIARLDAVPPVTAPGQYRPQRRS
jgi:hypothetical protein